MSTKDYPVRDMPICYAAVPVNAKYSLPHDRQHSAWNRTSKSTNPEIRGTVSIY
jgi:hypothetical protein